MVIIMGIKGGGKEIRFDLSPIKLSIDIRRVSEKGIGDSRLQTRVQYYLPGIGIERRGSGDNR